MRRITVKKYFKPSLGKVVNHEGYNRTVGDMPEKVVYEKPEWAKEKPQEIKEKKQMSSHAMAASQIRNELKDAFPNNKFRVKSESYSMGNSVDIRWENGVPVEKVNKIVKQHQYGHFDGMTDCYEYSNTRKDISQVKYVMAQRELTDDLTLKCAKVIAKEEGYPIPQTKEDLGNNFKDISGYLSNYYQIVYSRTRNIDFTGKENLKVDESFTGGSIDEGYESY